MKRVVVSATAVNSPNSAEGILLTLPSAPLPSDPAGQLVGHNVVDGVVNFTAGAGTTAVVIRVRRGTTVGGALVGAAQTHTLAAAAQASIAFSADDPAGGPAIGQQYVVTIQQTGGTGAGTMAYGVATTTLS